jgi:hypothetical protein
LKIPGSAEELVLVLDDKVLKTFHPVGNREVEPHKVPPEGVLRPGEPPIHQVDTTVVRQVRCLRWP